MSKEKATKEATMWLWSLLIALVMALIFAVIYWVCYRFPTFYESLKNFYGSAGAGQLAPPKTAMIKFGEVILFGTPLIRLMLAFFMVMEETLGGGTDERN